jgi:hypothetical protein
MRSITAGVVVVVRSLVLLLSLETLSIPTTATSCMMVAAALLLLLLCDKRDGSYERVGKLCGVCASVSTALWPLPAILLHSLQLPHTTPLLPPLLLLLSVNDQ